MKKSPMAQPCKENLNRFWPNLKWPEFAAMPDKEEVVVYFPIFGFADWGLGLPLDVEEVISMAVLAEASNSAPDEERHLVLPPLRFVATPNSYSAFGVSLDVAHQSIRDVAHWVKEVGFRKLVLYNSSPWNEDVVDVAARDLRVYKGLQMFAVNLAGIGLDLLPGRSATRLDCLLLGSYLLDRTPGKLEELDLNSLYFNLGGDSAPEVQLPNDLVPEEAAESGKFELQKSAKHLASLMSEIYWKAPLRNHGQVIRKGSEEK